MHTPAAPPRRPACDGCHGSRVCWVCQGSGCAPSPRSRSRCAGDGVCRLCLDVPAQRRIDLTGGGDRDALAEQA